MQRASHFFWQDLNPDEIRALAKQDAVALLPLAAIEQHGPHLPLSTDLDIGLALATTAFERLSQRVPACLLPPLSIGLSLEHRDYPGTLSLSPETALAVLTELGDSVARAGFRRLVIFNSHGGNKAIVDLAALKLRAAHRMLVVRANYFRFTPPPDALPAEEMRHGLHGGALETAMMLHIAPHKVRRHAVDSWSSCGEGMAASGRRLGPEGEAGFAWMAGDLNPAGVTGNARLATAELGERLVGHFADTLAQVIDDAHRFNLDQLVAGVD
ncbi:MAG: creatininase family protein [Azoarcus sp.]|jgi:creatinine amidohydrolase|nr:creatininase family protein [Azoarcus sp.]MDD2875443.1 creatininase family protein [Azoarcus sp.]MDX9837043.1 creatininase family protein [Azoarcus sp.]